MQFSKRAEEYFLSNGQIFTAFFLYPAAESARRLTLLWERTGNPHCRLTGSQFASRL
jgi:hypothetical protein